MNTTLKIVEVTAVSLASFFGLFALTAFCHATLPACVVVGVIGAVGTALKSLSN